MKGKLKFPIGIILILVLYTYRTLGLSFGLKSPALMVGTNLLKGILPALWYIISIIIQVTIIYGLIEKEYWSKYLVTAWAGIGLSMGVFNTIMTFVDMEGYLKTMKESIPDLAQYGYEGIMLGILLAFLYPLIINGMIIIYVLFKKNYFNSKVKIKSITA